MTARRLVGACRWAMLLTLPAGVLFALALSAFPGRQQLFLFSVAAYAAVGWVVTRQRPANPLGWLFLLVGTLTGLAAVSDALTRHALAMGQPDVWYGRWGAWFNAWFWFPLFASATLFTLLLFPDGSLSRRWRPVLWVSVVASALLTLGVSLQTLVPVGATVRPAKGTCPPGLTLEADYQNCGHWVDNPLGAPSSVGQTAWGESVGLALVSVLVVCYVLAAVSVVLRFHRSEGEARLQMRWFAFGAVVLIAWLFISGFFVQGDPIWSEVCFALATALIPVSCGIAILRYRLYEIDRIISRTASYAIVTGALLATYALVVTAATRLLPSPGKLPVAAATLAAAVIARPLYRRVQHAVDRRFNRARYDAERTVDEFGARLRHEVDTTVVSDDLVRVVQKTLQPQGAALWLRDGP